MTMIEEVGKRPRQISLGIIGVMHLAMAGAIYGQPIFAIDDSSLWHLVIPLPIRSVLWGTTGVVGIAGSFSRHRLQMFGFVVVTLMPMARALSYLWSWLMWLFPGGYGGYAWSFWEFLWWGTFVLLIIGSSGLLKIGDSK